MFSALVVLPRGPRRNLFLRELRRLKVRVLEDSSRAGVQFPKSPVDLLVIGSDVSPRDDIHRILKSRRSPRPEVIILETSRSAHASPAYEKNAWCLHEPLQACLVQACLRSIIERRKLADRVTRLQRSRQGSDQETAEEHSVDDLWFSIFDRLSRKPRK